MKSKLLVVMLMVLLLPVLAAAETWQNAALIDNHCVSTQAKANPDAHTRECMLQCRRAGYGILTSDGTYLKLDANGNEQVVALLKSATQKDHLRVTVVGERAGDTIKVTSVKM